MRKLSAIITLMLLILIMVYVPPATYAQGITFKIYTDKQTYLDTDTVVLTYIAYNSGGRVVGGGNGRWYLNDSASGENLANGTLSGSHGEVHIFLKNYNFTSAGTGRNFKITALFYYENVSKISSIDIIIIDSHFLMFQVSAIPHSSGFYPSTQVTIKITSPVPSEKVKFLSIMHNAEVWKNITDVKVGYEGTYTYSFIMPDNWKIGDYITITSRIGNSTANTGFTVGEDHDIYLTTSPGTTIISGNNLTITVHYKNITSPYFHFYVFAGGSVIYRYFTNENQVEFKVPKTYQGYLDIQCQIFNSTKKITEENTMVMVKYGTLRLESDHTFYIGGEKIKIFAMLKSNVIKNPIYIYTIYAMNNSETMPVKESITNSSEFVFNVGKNPPDAYIISVSATNGSYSTQSTISIRYVIPLHFVANIITTSAYTTGVYTPGEKIEIHYSISGLPGEGFLYYGFGDAYYSTPKIIRVAGNTTGDIEITIPKHTQTGFYLIHMRVVGEKISREIAVPISVNSNPPWSQYMILTIPAADFVTLVIVLATTLAGVVYIKYGKKDEPEKKDSKSTEKPL